MIDDGINCCLWQNFSLSGRLQSKDFFFTWTDRWIGKCIDPGTYHVFGIRQCEAAERDMSNMADPSSYRASICSVQKLLVSLVCLNNERAP